MKQYPRISRLSTVGLRQHQGFDYEFHPFRTDFIGESGCGKSMIADLLQLIFVGSEQFVSATEALGGKRLPDGMVLKSRDKRGTEIGYAFLTIEVAAEQYIVLGTYIESAAKTTTAFVIQGGYDEEEMTPLPQKLSFQDLLKEDRILPLDELKPYLHNKGLYFQSWFQKKGYYKFLYRHRLLSLDLSVGNKIVRDYAQIIQSFSRGKSLDTQKGEALKQFLFGDEKAKDLLAMYHVAVKEMQTAFHEYGENVREIEIISRKQKALVKLLQLDEEMKSKLTDWLYTKCMYAYQQELIIRNNLKEAVKETLSAYHALLTLKKLIDTEYDKQTDKQFYFAENETKYRNAHEHILPFYSRVKKVSRWLAEMQLVPNELTERYIRQRLLSRLKKAYLKVSQRLKSEGLSEYFETIREDRGRNEWMVFLDHEKESKTSALEEKKSYRQFADITDKRSMGFWALQQQRALTLEEESMVIRFKTLSTVKPTQITSGSKYFLNPNDFLEKASIVDPDENGFWLHLNGLREYIPFVNERLFTADKIGTISQFFQNWTKDLEKDIRKLENEIGQVYGMRTVIVEESDFSDFNAAISQKEDVLKYTEGDLSRTPEEEFKQSMDAYDDRDKIEREYTEAKNHLDEWTREKLVCERYLKAIDGFQKSIKGVVDSNSWINLTVEVRTALLPDEIQMLEDDHQLLKYITEEMQRSSDKELYIGRKIEEYKGKMRTRDVPDLYSKWKSITESKESAWKSYQDELGRYPIEPEPQASVFPDGAVQKVAYDHSKKTFEGSYIDTVNEFLANDSYKFVDIFDCKELGHALLPKAFHGKAASDDLIEAINHYLNKINDNNRELNKRKLQRIRDLLDEVNTEVGQRLMMAKRIDLFLKDKEITGGHKVKLRVEQSKEYPKEWIDDFQTRLDNDVNSLISEEVAKGISLEEKMIAAFRACTSTAAANPKIEKLLDPNAYLEVSFSMESNNGQVNKGSTGQSYAGIALLCIARLSIIGARDERKNPPSIRFMPIDEAEGLGSNYDLLYSIAKENDYQIISLSINPLGKFQDGEQYIYMLQKNTETEEAVNYQPFPIFCEGDKENES
ncbi:hypothetical protein [Puia dinghuensis]|uniref:Uncharacterized protein n=1 Tax=Puia dinghuensis TaxID=1792502 RepID=A0A8J2UHT8_9BACT|nr:hypothetical protein [Puia dinghuensis]GGB19934.1 hypothetical protein GCM10011511_49640 [Puia dinghuensis]